MKISKSQYTSEILDLYYEKTSYTLTLTTTVKNQITSMYADEVSVEDAVDEFDWLYNN